MKKEEKERIHHKLTNAPNKNQTTGVGFFSMVGTGVLVQSGVVYSFATGPVFSVITGGSIFVGAGSSQNVGVINLFSASSNSHHGQGTTVYDMGDSTWVGCPSANAVALAAFYGLGGVFSHPGPSIRPSIWGLFGLSLGACVYVSLNSLLPLPHNPHTTQPHTAGNMVYVGSPSFGTAALQYFAGLGGFM